MSLIRCVMSGVTLATVGVILLPTLALAQSDTAKATLSWTAPGDDGAVGQASLYDIRFSTSAINDINWAQATPVTGPFPAPQPATQSEQFVVKIPNALLGQTYHVAIRTRDEAFNWSGVSNSASFVHGFSTGIDDDVVQPTDFKLGRNYPNPFNPSTTIRFSVPYASHVRISVYNVLGRPVRELVGGFFVAGSYQVEWDARDDRHRALPSGIYFYTMTAGRYVETAKMTLLQ